jgi:hypothetical protein
MECQREYPQLPTIVEVGKVFSVGANDYLAMNDDAIVLLE